MLFRVRYSRGPKSGLDVHFFGEAELERLFVSDFEPILGLRISRTRRDPASLGQWSQWEAIFQKKHR